MQLQPGANRSQIVVCGEYACFSQRAVAAMRAIQVFAGALELQRPDFDSVVARDQLPFAKAELSTHDNQRVTKALNDGLQAALTGTKTPEQALKDAQREAERLQRGEAEAAAAAAAGGERLRPTETPPEGPKT